MIPVHSCCIPEISAENASRFPLIIHPHWAWLGDSACLNTTWCKFHLMKIMLFADGTSWNAAEGKLGHSRFNSKQRSWLLRNRFVSILIPFLHYCQCTCTWTVSECFWSSLPSQLLLTWSLKIPNYTGIVRMLLLVKEPFADSNPMVEQNTSYVDLVTCWGIYKCHLILSATKIIGMCRFLALKKISFERAMNIVFIVHEVLFLDACTHKF